MVNAFYTAFKGRKVKAALAALVVMGLSNLSAFALQTINLAWDASIDPSVSGYNIYYGSVSGNYTNQVSLGDVSNAAVSGLLEGNTYFFVVTAFDASGLESDPSNEISYTVPTYATNQPPTLDPLNNVTIKENDPQQTINLSGITAGASNEIQTLSVTATSSNPGIVLNPTVNYTSPNATGTLSFTPAVNAFGSSTITVIVNDGQAQNNTVTRSFVVTVNAVNQSPTLNPLSNITINENAPQQTVNLSGITSGASNEIQTLSVTATSSNPGIVPAPTINYTSPNATGTMSFTPAVNAFGTSTITVTVNDGQAQNNTVTRSFVVTVNAVNQPPTLNPLSNITINENDPQQTINLSGITSGATNEMQTLSVAATSSNPGIVPAPTINYTSASPTGTLSFTPAVNAFGTSTITVIVNDGQAQNNTVTRSFVVTVNAVNQSPTLNPLSNITINENAPQQTVNLSGITSGASNEIQTLSVTATSSNPGIVPAPTINYTSPNATGTLSFTPAVNAFGTSTIIVTVNDGQAQNNTVTRSFVVTVNAVNQPPTLNPLSNITINENDPQQTINLSGITSGASNEIQTLSVTATSSNPGIVPAPTINYTSPNATGTLSFTPAVNAFGTSTIIVTVNDGQAQNNTVTRSFVVTVNAVNQPPTLNPLSNITINENDPQQTINLSGITSGASNEIQILSVTATSSNPGIVPAPTINYTSPNATGTMSFTPAVNAFGTSTITVTVNDGQAQNNTVTRSFVVTVNAINQPPTLNPLTNVTINENASQQTVNLYGITSGATNEIQPLVVTATSSNPGIIPTPTVNYTTPNATGTVGFTPAANAFGASTITVSVNDGQTQNNTVLRSFVVTVNAVNQPPTLNLLADLTINENAGTQTINLSGISCGAANEIQALTVNATSSNASLVPNPTVNYTSPNTNGTLTFTPNTNVFGTATVSVTVDDGQASNNIVTRTFRLTVNQVNEPPTISFITNQITTQDTATPPIQFTVTDRETAASNLIVSAHSSNTALISDSNILLSGTGNLRSVTLNPSSGQTGDADITVAVTDGAAMSSTTFRLSVVGITNSAPIVIVQKTGNGRILPDLNGQTLSAGITYTLNAIPDPGQVFTGWTGSIISSSTNLTFVLSSNLTLTANFAPSPYVLASGTYSGLFYEEDQVRQYSAGFFTVSISTHGTYSGRLQIGAKRYSFASRIDPQGLATNVILRNLARALQVELRMGRGNQADQIFGRVTDGTWVASLSGSKSSFNSTLNPAPYRGSYTLHVPGSDGEGSLPIGDGFGAVRVSTTGIARLVGTLSDGTKVSQSAAISKDGLWPLYVSLYSGRGSMVSWLAFTNQASSDLGGPLSWIKAADIRARYYPNGFTNECNVVGSTYVRPATATNLIFDFTNAHAVFWSGDAGSSFTNYLTFKAGNRVTNLSSNRLAMTISSSSGTFTGSAMDPDTGKLLPFKGVVLQKQDAGCGFLLGTNRSSRVVISP